MNTLVFDIETVPDVEFGRRLFGLEGLSDDEVGKAMQARARQESGSDFLPHEQHRIVAISCAFRSREGFRVWSLGDESATERELVERFFDGIDKFTPDLVSWNGGGFDLPVLHYRALRFQVQAPRYWETGDEDNAFRYNNYLGRFHWRHIDVMDVLSGYQARARASLSDTAVLLGFPGKLGFDGSQVWDAYRDGELTRIRRYCETDVINTWLIFLRFQHMRGRLTDAGLADELARTRTWLTDAKQPHFDEFLAAWSAPRREHARAREGHAGIETGVVADLTHEAEGVVRGGEAGGKIVFVAGALPGERISFRRRSFHKSHDEAELARSARGVAARVTPRCAHFGVCGGCAMQHLDPAAQIEAKQKELAANLERIGNVEPAEWLPPLLGPHWNYRRRARLSSRFVTKKGRSLVGLSREAGQVRRRRATL